MNKNSKSGKYNFSLTTLNDICTGIILSYTINEYPVSERITRTNFNKFELVTIGFDNGIDCYNYISLLESSNVQQLTNDKTTLELFNQERNN